MGSYIPSTADERREMLSALGLKTPIELYRDIPESIYTGNIDIAGGLSEVETLNALTDMAKKNKQYDIILRGAGAYDRYIPSVVRRIAAKEEFVTAYTPYQAEISQGVLQSIFEFQTSVCELTGLDCANASVYDGATAAAEAISMCRDRRKSVALVSAAAHPNTISVIKTYATLSGGEVRLIPCENGITSPESISALVADDVCCVYLEQPNFFGCVEDVSALVSAAHECKIKAIVGINPTAAAVLKSPGECGADIAVGDGQSLGLPLSFGGPYIGFMAAKKELLRKLPGRIVGQTVDKNGNRCFVLTLQAREQHIRREKASSNICSNQALCALTVSAYLSVMGASGLKTAALSSCSNAHYLANELLKIEGVSLAYPETEFFNEFLTKLPQSDKVLAALDKAGILGGLPVDGGVLWCCTEKQRKADLDRAVSMVKEVLK